MIRLALASLALLANPAWSQAAKGAPATAAPIVFFDIAGPDMASQKAFYKDVFGWEANAMGSLAPPITTVGSALPGTLRADPAERVIYIGVPDIKATEAVITAHGGKIVAPRFVVPEVVILALFTDPAGNRMGLVETKDGKPVVP